MQLPDSFQRLWPAVEVLQENLNIKPLQALQQVIHKDIGKTYFIDLDHQLTLFELGVQLLSGFSLATNLLEQQQKLDQWLKDNSFSSIHAKIDTTIIVEGEEIKKNDWTPLHSAAYSGQTQIAVLLLQHGADVHAKDNKGWTPLHRTARNGNTEIAVQLLQHGADIHAKQNNNWTPLHYATRYCDIPELTKLLLQHGADVNAKEEDNWTPLHLAAQEGKTEIAVLLLQHRADVHAKTNKGWTPLHRAAEQDKREVAKLLLQDGTDVNAKNNDGDTPLDRAIKKGNTKTADYLRSKGGKEG